MRDAVRAWRRHPSRGLLIVVCLALGIGMNGVMWSVMDTLFFAQPRGLNAANQLARLFVANTTPGGTVTADGFSYPTYASLRERGQGFLDVAGYFPVDLSVGRGTRAASARVGLVTARWFRTLDIAPEKGRLPEIDDDRSTAAVAVISDQFWRRHFGGSDSALGAVLYVGRQPYTVIGIGPPGFVGIDPTATDVWVPLASAAPVIVHPAWAVARSAGWLKIIVRLRPAASRRLVASQVTTLIADDDLPQQERKPVAILGPLLAARGPQPPRNASLTVALAAATCLLLLITIIAVSGMVLTHLEARRHDIGIRVALGLQLRQLLLGQIAELAMLTAGGGLIASLFVTPVSRMLLLALLPTTSMTTLVRWPAIVVCIAVIVVASLTLPVMRLARSSGYFTSGVSTSMQTVYGHSRQFATTAILSVQTAVSVVLLWAMVLYTLSAYRMLRVPTGVDALDVSFADVAYGAQQEQPARVSAVAARAADRIRRLPDVDQVALATALPFVSGVIPPIATGGQDVQQRLRDADLVVSEVSPEYFAALGLRITDGRAFDHTDLINRTPTVVVSRTFATLVWTTESPIGQCLQFYQETSCRQVVGVIDDMRQATRMPSTSVQVYVPLQSLPDSLPARYVLVRSVGGRPVSGDAIRREFATAAPDWPFVPVRSLASVVLPSLPSVRASSVLITVFGVLSLLVAMIGVYGVTARAVAARRREVGIRIALGASDRDLVLLFARWTILTALVGIAAGVAGAWLAAPWLTGTLFHVTALDPRIFAAISASVLGVCLAATLIPARRALSIRGVEAMRAN